jgi:diguanylate cyclase (GGDEF)-like protein
MKLKYKLFLCIFPLAALLLLVSYSYASRREAAQHRERLESLFANALSGLAEFETREDDALKVSAGLAAQDPAWRAVNAANEKDLVPQALLDVQKRATLDVVFYAAADGTVRYAASVGDRFALDEIRQALSPFFFRSGDVKKKSGFFSLQGKIYQACLAPVAMDGQDGYVGLAVLFPFASYLRAAGGFDSAVSGSKGKWSGSSVAVNSDDGVRLSNLSGDEIERITISGGSFYARVARLDADVPALRVAVLAPAAALAPRTGDLAAMFLFCLVVAALAAVGLSWALSLSVSRPLELVARSVRAMGGSGAPAAVPSSLAERRDEVGAVAASFNQLASSLGNELKQKEKALSKLEKYQAQLLDLNHRLAKKLYENRVMLSLWKEQEKSEDTKDFLSHILEEVLQGLSFHYGCIIIRPLAQIGPEVILARIERRKTGKDEISVTDILERSDRTLWLSSLSHELKEFLLRMNQESAENLRLLQDAIHAPIEPEAPARNLSVVSIRLAQGNQHMGSLHLITEKERFALSASDEEFLTSVAAQVSVALDNRALQFATRVDPLTRLYNRGYMNDRLREEMLRTSRTNRPFTLLLLDIDHFKKVNDTYGHPAGDEVLVGLAALLKRSCRASDALCRYGGEEIALILVDTPLTGAKAFAENMRKTIESESFTIPDGKSLHITASMGLAEFPSQAGSMSELLKHADDALYKAKREGRNVWRAFSA